MDTMQVKRIIMFVAICLCVINSSWAQVKINSIENAQKYALEHNYGRKIQQMKISQAQAQKQTANAFLYPNISAGMNGQYNIDISETPVPGELVGKPGETVFMKFGKEYSYTAGLNVNYNILNWTSVYQSRIAASNIQLAQANNRYYEQQLKEQVGQNYYAVTTAIQAEKIWEQSLLAADTIVLLTQKKFDEGIVDRLNLNQAIINKMQVEQQLERTKAYTIQITNQLKMLLGINENDSITLTEIVPKEKIIPTVELPIIADSKAEVLKQQEKVADYEMKASLATFAPQVSLKGYFGANQFWNDLNFSFNSNDWRKSNNVGISITMPIFTGFANKSKYDAAKIQKKMAQTAYNEEVANAELKNNSLLKQYFSAMNIANTSFDKMRLSGVNLALARKKYEQGLLSLTDYLEFFNLNLSVQNQYLSDLSDFRAVKATIDSRK